MTTLSVNQLDTRGSLAAITGQVAGQEYLLTERGREGLFRWSSADESSGVASDPQKAVYIAPASSPPGTAGAWVRVDAAGLKPEFFGAVADGTTNDTDAFAALGAFIQAQGGGAIELAPGATYIVGKQMFLDGQGRAGDIVAQILSYFPSRILWLTNLTRGLTIRGNGARLKAAAGLKYGVFDQHTGAAYSPPMPYLGNDIGLPYDAMIGIHASTGPILIENLELDGNSDNYVWGGQRGDTGWQLPANGMLIEQCPKVLIENVYSHHHGLDGLQCEAGGDFTVLNSRFQYNCRLNGNLRAGIGFMAVNCEFDFAAKGAHFSAPASGFDIEAEISGEPILSPKFVKCKFRHNRYNQMASDTGDVRGASFDGCLFWSGTNDGASVYISRGQFRFHDCVVGGPIVAGGQGTFDLPLFTSSLFTDDPAYGSLDGSVSTGRSIVNTNSTIGLMFKDCAFAFTKTQIPGTPGGIIYEGCTIINPTGFYTVISGTYRNHCVIIGTWIDLGNSSTFYLEDDTCTFNGSQLWKNVGVVRAAQQADAAAMTTSLAAAAAGATPTQGEFNALVDKFNLAVADVAAVRTTLNGELAKLRAANVQLA